MIAGTRHDGLRLQLSASDVEILRSEGTLEGVVVLAAGGRNGRGSGRLIAGLVNGTRALRWQAPGSLTPGAAQMCAADGTYLVEDGEDRSKWVRVLVFVDYVPASGAAVVALLDRYNGLGPDDVTAAEASAGLVETTTYTLKNMTGMVVRDVNLWIDTAGAGAAGLTVSSDNVSYYAPDSRVHPNVLAWSTIAAAASVNVYMRRTVLAGAASNPGILNVLQWAWTGF